MRRSPSARAVATGGLLLVLAFGGSAAMTCSSGTDTGGEDEGGEGGSGIGGGSAGEAGRGGGGGRGGAGASGQGGGGSAGQGAGGMGTGGSSGGKGGAAGQGGVAGRDAGVPDAAVTDPVPVFREGRWSLAAGSLSVVVDASQGGRITSVGLAAANLLTGPEIEPINWGSTIWTSPQSVWTWPPPAEIDSQPYQAEVVGSELRLVGMPSGKLGGLSVTKRVRVDVAKQGVVLEYGLVNGGGASTMVAPWEVTRVRPGGLSFFALGPAGRRELGRNDALSVTERDGVAWFDMPATTIDKSRKLFADGKGWLAHVDRASRTLFVKSFPDVPVEWFAPGEAEIEIYVDGQKRYVELEQQGPYANVAAAATLRWQVGWRLRTLPADVPIEVGSAALVAAALASLK